MNDRKIMVEVTEEELQKIKNGFKPSELDIINYLTKNHEITSIGVDPITNRNCRTFTGTLIGDGEKLDYVLKIML